MEEKPLRKRSRCGLRRLRIERIVLDLRSMPRAFQIFHKTLNRHNLTSKAFIWGRLNANLEFGALWGPPAFYSWISNFKLYTIRFIPNTFSAKIIHPLNFLQALVIWSYTFCNCSLGINCCCWEIRNVIRKLDITNNNCHFKTGAFRRPQINALLTSAQSEGDNGTQN